MKIKILLLLLLLPGVGLFAVHSAGIPVIANPVTDQSLRVEKPAKRLGMIQRILSKKAERKLRKRSKEKPQSRIGKVSVVLGIIGIVIFLLSFLQPLLAFVFPPFSLLAGILGSICIRRNNRDLWSIIGIALSAIGIFSAILYHIGGYILRAVIR